MTVKFRNQFSLIILTVIGVTIFMGCRENGSKVENKPSIVGTWKRTDREVGMTNQFTADGDYIVKTATGSLTGKYELKNDDLRVYFPQSANGKDMNFKIFKLENKLLILESDNNGEKTYSKLEKTDD